MRCNSTLMTSSMAVLPASFKTRSRAHHSRQDAGLRMLLFVNCPSDLDGSTEQITRARDDPRYSLSRSQKQGSDTREASDTSTASLCACSGVPANLFQSANLTAESADFSVQVVIAAGVNVDLNILARPGGKSTPAWTITPLNLPAEVTSTITPTSPAHLLLYAPLRAPEAMLAGFTAVQSR